MNNTPLPRHMRMNTHGCTTLDKKKNHPRDSRREERCSTWYHAQSGAISAGQKSRTVADRTCPALIVPDHTRNSDLLAANLDDGSFFFVQGSACAHVRTHTQRRSLQMLDVAVPQIGVGVFHAWLFHDRADGWVSEVFVSTDGRRACRRGAIGSTMGAYPRDTGSNPVEGNGHFFPSYRQLYLSSFSDTHTHTHTHTHIPRAHPHYACSQVARMLVNTLPHISVFSKCAFFGTRSLTLSNSKMVLSSVCDYSVCFNSSSAVLENTPRSVYNTGWAFFWWKYAYFFFQTINARCCRYGLWWSSAVVKCSSVCSFFWPGCCQRYRHCLWYGECKFDEVCTNLILLCFLLAWTPLWSSELWCWVGRFC